MADIDIPQAEADALIAMEKQCVENKTWLFPEPGGRLAIALASPDQGQCPVMGMSFSERTKNLFAGHLRRDFLSSRA